MSSAKTFTQSAKRSAWKVFSPRWHEKKKTSWLSEDMNNSENFEFENMENCISNFNSSYGYERF